MRWDNRMGCSPRRPKKKRGVAAPLFEAFRVLFDTVIPNGREGIHPSRHVLSFFAGPGGVFARPAMAQILPFTTV